ncbi:uncharacterized protein DUF4956 [Sediminihabitans luteus]|uniref:Uncharacterized protein DUF4956 n=2 Tax=Sediminihabitans luteus TaxID=1138585 RepID=A0A2M9D0R3_9CELL|nr:uncharacterized protein DUF4956 [Sediminihabitans luteus]
MGQLALFGVDLVAIAVLTFGIYFPRHRRRDLAAAYLGLNVGVLAVSGVLAQSAIGAGLGLGLFGVLSIIRLRSSEIAQHEVAYYFSALAIGLLGGLGGLGGLPAWMAPTFIAVIVVTMFVGDHPRLLGRYRSQTVVLDTAITDESRLVAHLEALLGARVRALTVQKVDLVNDTTVVEVRYELPVGTTAQAGSGATSAFAGVR